MRTVYRIIIFIFLIFLILQVGYNAKVVIAQPPAAPPDTAIQINEVNTRLDDIQSQLDNMKGKLEEVSKLSTSTIGNMSLIYSVASSIIAIFAAALTFFGFHEWRHVRNLRKEFENEITEVKNLSRHQRAHIVLRQVDQLIDKQSYEDALKGIESILKMEITDKKLLASVYSAKGYILKRLDRFAEALACAENAYKLDNADPIYLYNSACYSILKGDKAKGLKFLKEALEKKPDFKHSIFYNDILIEEDFVSLKDDSEFRSILGIASITQLTPIKPKSDIQVQLAELRAQLSFSNDEITKITTGLDALERKLVNYCGVPITIKNK